MEREAVLAAAERGDLDFLENVDEEILNVSDRVRVKRGVVHAAGTFP